MFSQPPRPSARHGAQCGGPLPLPEHTLTLACWCQAKARRGLFRELSRCADGTLLVTRRGTLLGAQDSVGGESGHGVFNV